MHRRWGRTEWCNDTKATQSHAKLKKKGERKKSTRQQSFFRREKRYIFATIPFQRSLALQLSENIQTHTHAEWQANAIFTDSIIYLPKYTHPECKWNPSKNGTNSCMYALHFAYTHDWFNAFHLFASVLLSLVMLQNHYLQMVALSLLCVFFSVPSKTIFVHFHPCAYNASDNNGCALPMKMYQENDNKRSIQAIVSFSQKSAWDYLTRERRHLLKVIYIFTSFFYGSN